MRVLLPALLPGLLLTAEPVALASATSPKVIDGKIASLWSPKETTAVLEVTLREAAVLGGLHLYSGSQGAGLVDGLTVEFQRDGQWQPIPSAVIAGNRAEHLAVAFDATVEVLTDRLRLTLTAVPGGVLRVREVQVWRPGEMPASEAPSAQPPVILLNQSGFGLGRPKRFTAPTMADGTPFAVRPRAGGPAVTKGVIRGQCGDFSALDTPGEYVVEAGGQASVPFGIGPWWLERVTTQASIDFFIDSRHYLGTWTKPCQGSFGWRDDHHFGWELHALVPQLLANPAVVERLPRQMTYVPPTDPKLWGALQPPAAEAPDLVKLIHWGADVIVTQGTTHEHMKAQLAYFLYAWPVLARWLPEQNRQVVSEFARRTWSQPKADRSYPYDRSPDHNLLALKTRLGTTKGELPPGANVEPNVLMAEVGQREGWPEADTYLTAAVAQAAWMVANLDWNDPQVTKGQRMSEFITMTGLGHLFTAYPDRAPAGLRAYIAAWAGVVVRRSDNLWDFRKLDDDQRWTPMGDKPTQWNEVGNVTGLPAAIFAALPAITDPATRARLEVIAHAHLDNTFGRNPTGRHFGHRAAHEIEGVEFGWYSRHAGGIGQLGLCRFVLDGSPKNPLYPYQPEVGNIGWTEGWIQFNTPWNTSMAYLARHDSRLELRREGAALTVRLKAPVGFDPKVREEATVTLRRGTDVETLVLQEETADSPWLRGVLPLAAGPGTPGDRVLGASGAITAQYGFGWMATTAVSP